MKNKLFRRFYLLNVAIVVITLLMMMVMLSASVGNYITKEKRTTLFNFSETVSQVASQGTEQQNYSYIMRNLIITGKSIDAEVFIADSTGKITMCNCFDWLKGGACEHINEKIPNSALHPSLKGRFYQVGTLSGFHDVSCHTVGVPIKNSEGQAVGVVLVSSPASLLEEWLVSFSKMFLLCAILPLLLACVIVYIITYRTLKPLRMMSEAAHSLANGDFSKRIYCEGDDEISDLAASFNQMTNSLVQLESMRRSFVANVSHELRTPMTTIGGFIDGILDGTIEPDKQEYYLKIVSDEVKRLSRIVQSMLALARLESGEQAIKLTDVDLYELTCAVLISQEQRVVSKNISIEGLDGAESTVVSADRDLIYQVIYNLIDNAVKFTPENGYIRISLSKTDKKTVFALRNNGEGIEQKDLPKVFERFYKTDKSRSLNKDSSGLGLYIVKSITDLHGGTVTVRSVYGEYTEFEVALPNSKQQ